MKHQNMTCIICPLGCRMQVRWNESKGEIEVGGNGCKRGCEYAAKEWFHPTRTLTTTVSVTGGKTPVVSVKSSAELPKGLVNECMRVIRTIVVVPPVSIGQKIVENILESGIDIIATRDVQ